MTHRRKAVVIWRVLKTLLVLVALVLCTGAAWVGYRLYRHPELRDVVTATTELMELRRAGADDPGARAMRQAGCEQATAIGSADFARLLKRIDPSLRDREPTPRAPESIVECRLAAETGDCGELARTYAYALAEPPLTFAFTVETASGTPLCRGIYSQSGRRVRAIDPDERIELPDAVTSASRRRR